MKSDGMQSEPYSALGLYESGGLPPVLHLLASVLQKSVRKNEKSLSEGSRRKDVVTVFHGSGSPALTIRQYMERIFKYSNCSPSCFVFAYIYMDRFLHVMDACLTPLNVHRLLITSIMLAAKFLDDECYNNAYYAKVGGVSLAEMNRMEMKLLFNLDFRVHVTVEEFRNYCLKLGRECGSGDYKIDRPIHACGPKGGWQSNRTDTQNASTSAGYYNRNKAMN